MYACPFCTVVQIDTIVSKTNFSITDLQRRQLIAALLSRPHIILSGPPNIGKRKLAHALALAVTNNQEQHTLTLQGHPWWAARTGNVAQFVEIQSQFSIARISYFLDEILHSREKSTEQYNETVNHFAVCIQSMSPVEIDFYFDDTAQWLNYQKGAQEPDIPLHLIGTYNSAASPNLGEIVLRYAAVVHFDSILVSEDETIQGGKRIQT